MKVRCIYNTGRDLRPYESKILRDKEFGRFGASVYSNFGLTIDKEYLVMGMILGNGILHYLIDDNGTIHAYPYLLFKIVDNNFHLSWYFRTFSLTDKIYPNREAVWGYYELVFDDLHYEKLIDMEEKAMRIYFRRKIELEKKIEDENLMNGI